MTTPELQLHISDPKGKIVQNIKKKLVNQNNDLIPKLDSTHQHESKGMLSLQNKAPDIKILKFHVNRNN